jgi:general secretion pathway protein A
MHRLDPEIAVAFVVSPLPDFEGLLEFLLDDLGIGKGAETTAQRLVALQGFLTQRAAAGHRTLILIDEAQHLEPATLERIRLLSNFESPSEKLLQIVLAGQPELTARLALPQLRQLNQRLGLRSVVRPLTPEEVTEYIRSRLRIAGAPNRGLFTDRAVRRVARYARGVPRVVNLVCEHSLLIGYADQVRRIDHRIVAEAIRSLEARGQRSRGLRWLRWKPRVAGWAWVVGTSAAVVAGTVAGAAWYTRGAAALGETVTTYGVRAADLMQGVEALWRR